VARRPVTEPEIGGACFRTEVHRLVKRRGCFRKHDLRSVEIQDGVLLIFDKHSHDTVKSRIELPNGVDRVCLRTDTTLEISVSRPPAGVSYADGVVEHKDYAFEFQTQETASLFCEELLHQGVGQ